MGRYIGERVTTSDIVNLGGQGISKFCANQIMLCENCDTNGHLA